MKWLTKEADWYPQDRSSYLLDYENPSLLGHALVKIHMEHKWWHVFHPCREVSSYTSFLDLFVTSFLIIFLPTSWLSTQTTNHSPYISMQSHFWPLHLSGKMNNQTYRFKFCSLGGFPFTTVLHRCPKKYNSYPLLSGFCILCRTICKSDPSFLFLSQLIGGNFPWSHRYRQDERK